MRKEDILERYRESHEDELNNQGLMKGFAIAFYVQSIVYIVIMLVCLIIWEPTVLYGVLTMFWVHMASVNLGRYWVSRMNKYLYQLIGWVIIIIINFTLFYFSLTGVFVL